MKMILVLAGALTFAGALLALPSEDPYANFHEGIYSTDLFEQVPLFQKAMEEHPAHYASRHGLSVVYYRRGDYRKAIEGFEDELTLGKGGAMTHYDLACCYGLTGDKGKAVEHFRRAVRAGFHDWYLFRMDADMDPIRDEPEVASIAARHRGESGERAGGASHHRKGKSKAKGAPAASSGGEPSAPAPKAKRPRREKQPRAKRPRKGASASAAPAGEASPVAVPPLPPTEATEAPKPPPAAADQNPLDEGSSPAAAARPPAAARGAPKAAMPSAPLAPPPPGKGK